MPIGLTAKIEPKNDGFLGMVDADQIIGMSGGVGASYLPSSTISSNSLYEYQLKISNSPSDGYFLQYKDSTDELTWAETSTTDVAWSGASGFYTVSSNYIGHSSNTDIHYPSSQLLTWLNEVYQESGTSSDVAWSGAIGYYGFSSNVKLDITNLYNTSSSLDSRIDTLEGQEVFDSTQYITSTNAIDRFVESGGTVWTDLTNGGDITDTYHTHSQYGGGTSPGGSDHYVQFNNEGSFGGDSSLTWNDTTNTLRVSGAISSQTISGGTIIGTWQGDVITKPYISYAITGASDISWTTAFHNSGLKWDDGSKQWVAMASGGSPVTQLSAMTIDVDKDWQSKGIYNLSYISAATISGGSIKTDDLTIDANTISGLSVPLWPSSAVNKQYVDTRSNSGYAYVSSQGMIAHSLSSKPSYVNVMPSGFNVNFGVNCTVDDTNITVYLTIDGKRDVFWNAKI